MVLTSVVARRPHVLTVAPATVDAGLRTAVEAELARRRWPAASSPADTDVVLVLGTPGPRLADVVRSVWATVPAPRALVGVPTEVALRSVLDEAAAGLVASRGRTSLLSASDSNDVLPQEVGEPQMADLAFYDHDGLALDALHVAVGPVLPHWPAGLVAHVTLAGDLITDARAEVLDVPASVGPGSRGRSPLGPDRTRLDILTRVLGLLGADHLAARARQLRDRDPEPGELTTFGRRLRRNRPLRWALRDVPLVGGPVEERTLEERVANLAGALGGSLPPPVRPTAEKAVQAMVGLELGAARLALAAMDPDTALGAGPVTAFTPAEVAHQHH
ncbi:hypothetical protein [Actinomycetospora sp. NBRC 106378]|uniref:hypothetical protein n=1 Tax=Actinomycetospora sp. NBRC 106378 TaxID=3032208 RepID=UPI0024A3DAFF|nr:hypothetical protein [Actinomycetospora sp. NBRC 106378]GLZ53856.1 hypothetical protein Acsp07_34730 [Actinomycetospora sp. NBRC 106378]